jgi:hypothetical protein
MNLF